MNRHYTVDKYFEACCLIRKYFNKSAITTDLIVGFPGETDDEFLETINYVKKISLAQGHVFKYSKRTELEPKQCQIK